MGEKIKKKSTSILFLSVMAVMYDKIREKSNGV
jgi:hypothetical protein